jgi:predicted dithiol-disulfide oxidoreductase (DUF899 family)
MSCLLGYRGRVQWLHRPPGKSRCHAFGGVAGTACEVGGFQAADGLELPLGVFVRRRFNFDFNISLTEKQQHEGAEYNYRREKPFMVSGIADSLTKRGEDPVAENAGTTGTDVATYTSERPGMSAFVLEDGVVYHTYSAYSSGLDVLWGAYQWLDRAPKGRNEVNNWSRRHDEY